MVSHCCAHKKKTKTLSATIIIPKAMHKSMSMFLFAIYKFERNQVEDSDEFELSPPTHVMSLDYPVGQRIRLMPHPQNPRLFTISANLGNAESMEVKCSTLVFCGSTQVLHAQDVPKIVGADSWITLCTVDLDHSLHALGHKEEAYLRVNLNVSIEGGSVYESKSRDIEILPAVHDPRDLRVSVLQPPRNIYVPNEERRASSLQLVARRANKGRFLEKVGWWCLWTFTGKFIESLAC